MANGKNESAPGPAPNESEPGKVFRNLRNSRAALSSDEITEPGQILIDITYTVISTGEVQLVSVAGGV